MIDRVHEAEQRVHRMRVLMTADEMRIEADRPGTSHPRRAVLLTAIRLLRLIYAAPFRYADWRGLDDVVEPVADGGLMLARKAGRELGRRGELLVKGAVKGPALTRCRLAAMPPYPME